MWSSSHVTAKFCQVLPPSSAVFCQCCNTKSTKLEHQTAINYDVFQYSQSRLRGRRYIISLPNFNFRYILHTNTKYNDTFGITIRSAFFFFFFEIIYRFSCPKGAMPGLLFYRGKFQVITYLTYSSDSVRPLSTCLPYTIGVQCLGEKQISKIAKSDTKKRIERQSNIITKIYASRVSSRTKEIIEIK